jgi:hypothetical protein
LGAVYRFDESVAAHTGRSGAPKLQNSQEFKKAISPQSFRP